MARFRCFVLTPDDRVVWGVIVDAGDVQQAIDAALIAARDHLKQEFSRVEVWCGADLIYRTPKTSD